MFYLLSGCLVTKKDIESIDIKKDNKDVFDSKEDEHLMYDAKIDHDSESDHQERTILDEQSFNCAPNIRAVG